jgi:hypothetical protein
VPGSDCAQLRQFGAQSVTVAQADGEHSGSSAATDCSGGAGE